MAAPPYVKSDLPTGRSGEWRVERFEVRGEPGVGPETHRVPDCARRRPGSYTRLKRGDTVFMTDLYDEWYTQRVAAEEACRRGGRVLVTGLGLGLIVESMLRASGSPVERITVLELAPEVIELVGPHLLGRYGDRLEIVRCDAFTWAPPEGAHFSVVWHDVWPNPHAPETVPEMERLEERYRTICDWHGCWPREYRWALDGAPRHHGRRHAAGRPLRRSTTGWPEPRQLAAGAETEKGIRHGR